MLAALGSALFYRLHARPEVIRLIAEKAVIVAEKAPVSATGTTPFAIARFMLKTIVRFLRLVISAGYNLLDVPLNVLNQLLN